VKPGGSGSYVSYVLLDVLRKSKEKAVPLEDSKGIARRVSANLTLENPIKYRLSLSGGIYRDRT